MIHVFTAIIIEQQKHVFNNNFKWGFGGFYDLKILLYFPCFFIFFQQLENHTFFILDFITISAGRKMFRKLENKYKKINKNLKYREWDFETIKNNLENPVLLFECIGGGFSFFFNILKLFFYCR